MTPPRFLEVANGEIKVTLFLIIYSLLTPESNQGTNTDLGIADIFLYVPRRLPTSEPERMGKSSDGGRTLSARSSGRSPGPSEGERLGDVALPSALRGALRTARTGLQNPGSVRERRLGRTEGSPSQRPWPGLPIT